MLAKMERGLPLNDFPSYSQKFNSVVLSCLFSSYLWCYGIQGQNKPEPKGLWDEPVVLASVWRPCAAQRKWEPSGNSSLSFLSSYL